jgi:LacI family transcriptional regulator
MRDVAALAGVSLKTVSRVVNDEAGVSADVRERVAAAVQRLDYRPNLAASNLRRGHGKTAMVGALLQDVSNSFSSSLLRSLEDEARDRDVVIVAASLDEEPERERALVEGLVRRRVDGLLLMPATDRHDYLADDLRSGLPIVFVDRTPNGIDTDSVTIDNARGSRLAVYHLVASEIDGAGNATSALSNAVRVNVGALTATEFSVSADNGFNASDSCHSPERLPNTCTSRPPTSRR